MPALRESIVHGDDAWEASVVGASHRLEKIELRFGEGPVTLDDGLAPGTGDDFPRGVPDFAIAADGEGIGAAGNDRGERLQETKVSSTLNINRIDLIQLVLGLLIIVG